MCTAENVEAWGQSPDCSMVKLAAPLPKPAPVERKCVYQDVRNSGFWAFYMAYKGAIAYESVGKRGFQIEQETRLNAVGLLDGEAQRLHLKQHKISLREAKETLSDQKRLDRKGLGILAIAYEVPMVITFRESDFTICLGTTPRHALVAQPRGGYLYGDHEWLGERKAGYSFPCIGKPMLSISAYKVSDLKTIAVSLSLETSGLKRDLYARITTCLELPN